MLPPDLKEQVTATARAERIVSHVNRHLRSLLCTYSGMHACHPSHCLGPCPCIAWHSQAQPPKDSDDASKEDVSSETDEPPPVLGQQASYKMWLRTQEANFSAGESRRLWFAMLPPPRTVLRLRPRLTGTSDGLQEYDAARRERTDAFYRRRNAKATVPSGEPITGRVSQPITSSLASRWRKRRCWTVIRICGECRAVPQRLPCSVAAAPGRSQVFMGSQHWRPRNDKRDTSMTHEARSDAQACDFGGHRLKGSDGGGVNGLTSCRVIVFGPRQAGQ